MGTLRSCLSIVIIALLSGCTPTSLVEEKEIAFVSPKSCGTPHSRSFAFLQAGSSQKDLFLSNGAKFNPQMDTSQWPDKPWPLKMVWIPASTFFMGGVGKEAKPDELPVHEVAVDGFWMDQTEITNQEFLKFTKATKYLTTAELKPDWEELKTQLPPGTAKPSDDVLVPGSMVFTPTSGPVPLDNFNLWWAWVPGTNWQRPHSPSETILDKEVYLSHPVVQVSWYDAQAYALWSGKKLPTEAEWECAARAGKEGLTYAWGNDSPDDENIKANIWQGAFPYKNTEKDGFFLTSPVGSYSPNEYGLYDMMGNVWEWCSDWYRPDTYKKDLAQKRVQNPKGPKESYDPDEPYAPKRVVRGGSFLCHSAYCASYRPSARMKTSPDTGENHTGFRCVMSDAEWRIITNSKKPSKTSI